MAGISLCKTYPTPMSRDTGLSGQEAMGIDSLPASHIHLPKNIFLLSFGGFFNYICNLDKVDNPCNFFRKYLGVFFLCASKIVGGFRRFSPDKESIHQKLLAAQGWALRAANLLLQEEINRAFVG